MSYPEFGLFRFLRYLMNQLASMITAQMANKA